MGRSLIIDLSNNNRVQSLDHLRGMGITACYLKVTEGTHFFDPMYRVFKEKALRAGLRVGGYHFARMERPDAGEEALYFARHLGTVKRGDLRPMLDMEVNPSYSGRLNRAIWARDFCHQVHISTKYMPVFYSYSSYIEGLHLTYPVADGLLLSAFGRDDGAEHPFVVPRPWKRAIAHQFTSRAHVVGIGGTVDLSATHNLRALIAGPYFGLV